MGKAKLKLVPEERPFFPISRKNLVGWWPHIERGISEVLATAAGEYDLYDVFAELLNGGLTLFVGRGISPLDGFVITEKQVWPRKSFLLLYMVWVRPGIGYDFLEAHNEDVNAHARERGCSHVLFVSSRKANRRGVDFEDRMAEHGFKPIYTTYGKEVPKNGS